MFSSGNFKNTIGQSKINNIDFREREFKTVSKLVRFAEFPNAMKEWKIS